jgi:hypothetical protein
MSCCHSLCAPLSRENSHHASRISLDSHSLWEYICSAYQRNHAESAAAGFLIQASLVQTVRLRPQLTAGTQARPRLQTPDTHGGIKPSLISPSDQLYLPPTLAIARLHSDRE